MTPAPRHEVRGHPLLSPKGQVSGSAVQSAPEVVAIAPFWPAQTN